MHLNRKKTFESQNVGIWVMWSQPQGKSLELPNGQLAKIPKVQIAFMKPYRIQDTAKYVLCRHTDKVKDSVAVQKISDGINTTKKKKKRKGP